MKVGFIQFAPVLGDVQATIRKIDRLIHHCENTDILILPELCNSGYNFNSYQQAWETSEEVESSVFVQYLRSKCKQFNLYIVVGFNERHNALLYNSAILIGPKGYIGKYRKLHLFMNEKDYFKPGDVGLPVFDIGLCKIGMLVCFDWIFPEVWRILALKGAEIICHPSNLILPGFAQKAVPIHALTNRVYIVTANRIGTEGDLTFTGLSTIADPKGEILVQASQAKEEVGIKDIDITMARDKMITHRNDVFSDRRPGEYSLLTEDIVKDP
ncbi:MAG: nitrilase-related carbon-nitrogen hydrolase [Thermodesulfobacteriota bacterium]